MKFPGSRESKILKQIFLTRLPSPKNYLDPDSRIHIPDNWKATNKSSASYKKSQIYTKQHKLP